MKNSEDRIASISFHNFPRDYILRNAWLSVLGFEESTFSWKNKVVCSKHFEKDKFQKQNDLFITLMGPEVSCKARLIENGKFIISFPIKQL